MTRLRETLPDQGRPPARLPDRAEQRANLIRLLVIVAVGLALALATGAFPTVVVVIALFVMIMLHEFGHFVTAKAAGMKVTEFFLGFGPRLWSVRKGETEYGVKAIPAGGYVRIAGMHNLETVDPADEPRTYRQKPYWRRMSVALAGSTMHFLIALVLLYSLLAGFGVPRDDVWRVGAISALRSGASPAEEAGFRLGDQIVAVDGVPMRDWDDVRDYLRERPGEDVAFGVRRGGETLVLRAHLVGHRLDGERVGFLGISADFPRIRSNPVRSAGEALSDFAGYSVGSAKAVASFFSPKSLRDYAGDLTTRPRGATEGGKGDNRFLSPVGFVRVASQASDSGVAQVVLLLVLINIFVGWFNLFPLLPLDGGHVAIATYEKVRSMIRGERYTADVAKLLPLTYAVVVVLVMVGLTSLWLDIVRPLANPFQ
jgi:membrane-associated protease RseP (regulator of RpoE activity)